MCEHGGMELGLLESFPLCNASSLIGLPGRRLRSLALPVHVAYLSVSRVVVLFARISLMYSGLPTWRPAAMLASDWRSDHRWW